MNAQVQLVDALRKKALVTTSEFGLRADIETNPVVQYRYWRRTIFIKTTCHHQCAQEDIFLWVF